MGKRLDQLNDGELLRRLAAASPPAQRRAAKAAARHALYAVAVSDQVIDVAFLALDEGRTGDSPERVAVDALRFSLDLEAWTIQEQMELGLLDRAAEYDLCFERSRAVHALWFALEHDTVTAAFEAIYEAWAAVDDRDGWVDLRSEILAELESQGQQNSNCG